MTRRELINICQQKLTACSGDAARFEAMQLVGQLLAVPTNDLLLQPDLPVPPKEQQEIATLISRRIAGEPLQYLLGDWEFYGLPFRVGPGVLIPRPDTETVVDAALALLKGRNNPVIADLCSGSGAIGLALWHQRQDAEVYLVEQSPEAFDYLKHNTQRLAGNGGGVHAIKGDVLAEVKLPVLDMIISNPPYLTEEEMGQLPTEVKHEPEMALRGGEDGLLFYRHITKAYKHTLTPGGYLVFEVGYTQADAVTAMMHDEGYTDITTLKDLGGNDRCVYGRR